MITSDEKTIHAGRAFLSPSRDRAIRVALILALTLMLIPVVGHLHHGAFLADVEAQNGQWSNPRADFWRLARQGESGYTTGQGPERGVLIQSSGQRWRIIRNEMVAGIGPWVLGVVFFAILAFYVVKGPDKLEEKPSGEKIERWSLPERILHWITAVLFILLAVTGLSMLFGRMVLIPVMGHESFSGYMQVGKIIHNYAGPLFLAGILVEMVAWIKYNIPKKIDLEWFKKLGGMVGKGPRPHAEKINGGEKAWFWIMVLAGLGVGITGLIMNFPNFGQTRYVMQVSSIIHASLAILFVTASFGHIYIGTIGAEGTFEGMWSGKVSKQWAKQHQDLWYEKKTGKNVE